jgi:hypothetical protein
MLRHYEGGPRTPNSPILFTKGCSGFLRWLRRSLPVLRVAGCEPGPLVPRPREGSLHYLTRAERSVSNSMFAILVMVSFRP